MITCPTCQHAEVEGALFCSECGAQLVSIQNLKTQNFQLDNNISPPPQRENAKTAQYSPTDKITLQVLDGGQFISLSNRHEFTVGRISDGQPVMPDIDLTPYSAYENGVSRLHAVIKRGDTQVSLMDLGSSNGTYLNGTRLTPDQDYPLQHGHIVSFGKLKIQFLVQK